MKHSIFGEGWACSFAASASGSTWRAYSFCPFNLKLDGVGTQAYAVVSTEILEGENWPASQRCGCAIGLGF